MAGFHPPKHNNIVFRNNAFLCGNDWHYRLLNLAKLGVGVGRGRGGDLLYFNDTAHSKREINDTVYG